MSTICQMSDWFFCVPQAVGEPSFCYSVMFDSVDPFTSYHLSDTRHGMLAIRPLEVNQG